MKPIEQAALLVEEQIVATETALTAPATELQLMDRLHEHLQLGRLRKAYRELQSVLRHDIPEPAREVGPLDPFVDDYLGEDPR